MQEFVSTINSYIWSPALVWLLLGTGLFFSILTRFVQARMFFEMIHLLFSSKESDKGISSFQALAVSLSGRVGTGNIAGVAAAIGFGGPSAVFWMWVVAFLGASTAYIESALGQIYKEVDEGQFRGGPAYYFEKALGQKWYAWLFAIATIFATGILLPTVQSNSIGNAAELAFGGETLVTTALGTVSMTKVIAGSLAVTLLGIIIFGGVKRIAHVTQVVVPIMALAYIAMAINRDRDQLWRTARSHQPHLQRHPLPDGDVRRCDILGRQTWRLFERSRPGNWTACRGGIGGPAPGATGARAGVFGLR